MAWLAIAAAMITIGGIALAPQPLVSASSPPSWVVLLVGLTTLLSVKLTFSIVIRGVDSRISLAGAAAVWLIWVDPGVTAVVVLTGAASLGLIWAREPFTRLLIDAAGWFSGLALVGLSVLVLKLSLGTGFSAAGLIIAIALFLQLWLTVSRSLALWCTTAGWVERWGSEALGVALSGCASGVFAWLGLFSPAPGAHPLPWLALLAVLLAQAWMIRTQRRGSALVAAEYRVAQGWGGISDIDDVMLSGLPALARFFRCDDIHVLERISAPTLTVVDHSWNRLLGLATRTLSGSTASDKFFWSVANMQTTEVLIHRHDESFPLGWSEAISASLLCDLDGLGRLLLGRTGHDREPWAPTDLTSLDHSARLLAGIMNHQRLLYDLERVVLRDALTGLANEAGLLKVLDEELTTADREHAGMLYIDVNHFKEINDTLGHDVGDQALRIVAERIRAVVKVRDVAVRLHGDEFAVLTLQLAQLNHLQAIAERISEAVSEPTELPGAARLLSVSVGGVYQLPPNVRFGGVLKMSDRLMYAVKRNGGAHPIVLPYGEAQAQAYVSHP